MSRHPFGSWPSKGPRREVRQVASPAPKPLPRYPVITNGELDAYNRCAWCDGPVDSGERVGDDLFHWHCLPREG